MVSTLYKLSVDCLSRTNYDHPVPLLTFSADPLPSVAEGILSRMSSLSTLPLPVADGLIEALAKKGKLTESILRVLLDSKRARLSTLPLYGLCLADGNDVSLLIQGHKGLKTIDVSFSPCFSSLSAPFLTFVSEECQETLTFFSAGHVTGDIGLPLLSRFTNIRHLDVSFTSISFGQCCSVFSAFRLLEDLDVSGTCLSWHQLFKSATGLGTLKRLGMGYLNVFHVAECTLFSTPHFSSDWIAEFFTENSQLSTLDISFMKCDCTSLSSSNLMIEDCFHTVLVSTPCLTHLETSSLSLSKVAEKLQSTVKLEQLKFLGYFGEVEEGVPHELKSSIHLQMATKCSYPASQLEWCFRNERNDLKAGADDSLFIPIHRMENVSDFRDNGVVPFLQIFATSLRFQPAQLPQTFLKALKFVVWDVFALEPKEGNVVRREMWESILELFLQAGFEDGGDTCTVFGFFLCRLVGKFPKFVTERKALLCRSVAFVLKTISSKSDAGYLALSSFLPQLSDCQRRSLAFEAKLVRRLGEDVDILTEEYKSTIASLDDPDTTDDWFSWGNYYAYCDERA